MDSAYLWRGEIYGLCRVFPQSWVNLYSVSGFLVRMLRLYTEKSIYAQQEGLVQSGIRVYIQ